MTNSLRASKWPSRNSGLTQLEHGDVSMVFCMFTRPGIIGGFSSFQCFQACNIGGLSLALPHKNPVTQFEKIPSAVEELQETNLFLESFGKNFCTMGVFFSVLTL